MKPFRFARAPITFAFPTIERWYYQAREAADPVAVLTRKVRRDVGRRAAVSGALLKELETLRAAGKIGSSLAGEVDLHAVGEAHALLASLKDDVRFVMITSRATVHAGKDGKASAALPGVGITVSASPHAKCARCWHLRPDVGANAVHPPLCGRCVSNLFGDGELREHA
mgnify:CR=1 FL=1